MATIYEFTGAQKIPFSERANVAIAKLADDWIDHVKQGKTPFFAAKYLQDVDIGFSEDLNQIALRERSLNYYPIIYGPRTKTPEQNGWFIQFYMNEELFTMPEMLGESKARTFALIAWLTLRSLLSNEP
jgi:hypothetical protein